MGVALTARGATCAVERVTESMHAASDRQVRIQLHKVDVCVKHLDELKVDDEGMLSAEDA